MSSPLQKAPMGLLSALNLKTLGHNPDEFADTVNPSFNVNDLYTAEWIRQTSNGATGLDDPTSLSVIVDPGALWLLRSITALWDYSTGCNSVDEQWTWAITYQPPGSAEQITLAWADQLTAPLSLPLGGAFAKRLVFVPPHQMLFLPSTHFRAVTNTEIQMGSGTFSCYLRAEFIPLAP